MKEKAFFPAVKRGLCCGCGGCTHLFEGKRIEMRLNETGYLRPVSEFQLSDTDHQRLEAMCPGVSLVREPAEAGVPDDPVWGPMVGMYTGHATDGAIRHRASSGGALSAVLVYLLEQGDVDFVLHTRASDQHPFRNTTSPSRSREDVLAAAGSRYGPSSPLAGIDNYLDGSEKFAFVGKPCDVAALRQLARTDMRISQRIPYVLTFMCGGVPSEKGTEAMIGRLGLGGKAISSVRYRGNGWPGEAVAIAEDGTSAKMDYDTCWGSILNRHLQWRCKVCPDGTGEFSDITFADGWLLGDDGRPDFSERDGRSIILVRTRKGEALFKRVVDAGHLACEPQDNAYLDAAQPFQKKRKAQIVVRLAAMLATGRNPPRYKGLHLRMAMRQSPILDLAKGFAGTFVRLLQKRPS